MAYSCGTFKEISGSLQTGDIILFHGDEEVSKIIEFIENCQWSHVGMAVRPSDIGLEADCGSRPLLWHSTPSLKGIIDVGTKAEREAGPEIVYLEDVLRLLKDYGYLVAFRRLDSNTTQDMMKALRQYIETVHADGFPTIAQMVVEYLESSLKSILNRLFRKGTGDGASPEVDGSFEGQLLDFLETKVKGLCINGVDACLMEKILPDSLMYRWLAEFKDTADQVNRTQQNSGDGIRKLLSKKLSTHFCSELVAETYMHMGLLPDDTVPRSFSPKSFSSQGDSALKGHARLEKEIVISF